MKKNVYYQYNKGINIFTNKYISTYYKEPTSQNAKDIKPREGQKSSKLISIFNNQRSWNLAHVKFFILIINALLKAINLLRFLTAWQIPPLHKYIKLIAIKKHGKKLYVSSNMD